MNMAEVKWIKITTTMFEDEKIDFIESLPDADAVLIIWIKLLTLAGKCNQNGYIFLTESIPYTDEMLAHKFRRPINTVRFALETFDKMGMIQLRSQGVFISNWNKHQNIEGLDKIREQNRKRVADYRKKQRQLPDGNVTCNVTVTQCNGTDIDQELDIEKENTIILTSEEDAFFKALQLVKNYPFDRAKDLEMYEKLKERYPQLDLVESIKDWSTYKIDKPLKANCNPRSQINTSCKKHVEWGRNLKTENKPTPKPKEVPTKTVIR